MQRKFVVSDPDKCVGCRICDVVCAMSKEKACNPLLSRIRSVRVEPAINMSIACCLCEDPMCVKSCPKNALYKDDRTGVIQVHEDKCDGCAWCIETCGFGAITLHPIKKTVVICDLCGGNPICTQYCPTNALMLLTPEEISQKARKKITKGLSEKLLTG